MLAISLRVPKRSNLTISIRNSTSALIKVYALPLRPKMCSAQDTQKLKESIGLIIPHRTDKTYIPDPIAIAKKSEN